MTTTHDTYSPQDWTGRLSPSDVHHVTFARAGLGRRGYDELEGWQGNDRIEAADGRQDFVGCGPGDDDRASVDPQDYVRDCEIVNGERTG